MTKVIKGDLILKKDTTFDESLIVKGNIFGKNGIRYNLRVRGDLNCLNLNCLDLNCLNLNCDDLICWDLNCRDNVSYYAICFAYKNIKCKSIKGRRSNCKEPFVLDGTIEITGEVLK